MNLLTFLNTKLCACSYGYEHINDQTRAILNHSKRQRKLVNILLDIFLGILLCMSMQTFTTTDDITLRILDLRTIVKNYLENVLKWLMGVPAGLKLNHELSNFLGHFFLYHVYVWMSYLQFIEQYLNTLVVVVTYSSFFGVTFFLSLLNDLINLMTFHIYCFYVYAAKLYYLQLKGLMSLARLFMGKKWNVLRLRVDSISYDAEQLIIGTILFTILLFLLPTTLIFYVVFTLTRLHVLIFQEFIRSVVVIITRLSVFDLLSQDNMNFWFRTMDTTNEKHVTNTSNIQHDCYINKENQLHLPDIGDVFKKICTGVIIRPWRENFK